MKILVVHYVNKIFKDDTMVFCDGLKKLGHEIVLVDFFEKNEDLFIKKVSETELKDVDLIWAPYEIEIIAGNYFKNLLNKPLIGHFEWIAPWRVGDDPFYWGYDETNIKEINKYFNYFNKKYTDLSYKYFNFCDFRTVIDPFVKSTIEKFNKREILKSFNKPYIVDDKLLLSQTDTSIKPKYQIMSTARLVPHKRIHHIIQALAKVKNAPTYKVIGSGSEKHRLIKLAEDLKVDVEFVGTGQDGEKAKLIQESLFSINIWAGLPTAESAVFKKHSLVYDHICAHHASGTMSTYIKWNDIDDLAENIQYLIDNPKICKKNGEKSYDSLMSGENGILTTEKACLKLESIFKEVLK